MAQASAFRFTYDLAFQVSPIILHGGSAANALGGMMPIVATLSSLVGTTQGALSNGIGTNDFPWRFLPIPGGTVINNAVATYPFANQQVAADAIIEQPKSISLLMISPVKDTAGYLTKLALFMAFRASLQSHIEAGGTFHIATPSYLYTDCLLTTMTDVTPGDTKQQQVQWQIDFVQPLVTTQAADSAYNSLMQKLSGGSKITDPSWSGTQPSVGTASPGAVNDITQQFGVINKFPVSPQ